MSLPCHGKALLPHLDFHKKIRQGVLKVSQFPSTMKDKNGKFYKPKEW